MESPCIWWLAYRSLDHWDEFGLNISVERRWQCRESQQGEARGTEVNITVRHGELLNSDSDGDVAEPQLSQSHLKAKLHHK